MAVPVSHLCSANCLNTSIEITISKHNAIAIFLQKGKRLNYSGENEIQFSMEMKVIRFYSLLTSTITFYLLGRVTMLDCFRMLPYSSATEIIFNPLSTFSELLSWNIVKKTTLNSALSTILRQTLITYEFSTAMHIEESFKSTTFLKLYLNILETF